MEQKLTNEDIQITAEQNLQLAKIRKIGMENNKRFEARQQKAREDFWNLLGLRSL